MSRARSTGVRHAALVGLLLATLAPAARAQQSEDVVTRAMRDELARSMKELRLNQLERPYFIAYRVRENHSLSAAASYGSLLGSGADSGRSLSVEVRVGDYAFDNTNFFGAGGGMIGIGFGGLTMAFGGGDLPLDNDYLEIRRQLWLATDAAYKEAVETLAAKKASLLNRARTDTLSDFTREEPTRTTEELPAVPLRRTEVENVVRELSRLTDLAQLNSSTVSASVSNVLTRYLNSEGTAYTTLRPLVTLSATASTQAVDGQPLSTSMRLYARSIDAMPARIEIESMVRTMARRLDSLRSAATIERYSGPVLFEGRAAAELFSQVFAPALVARRRMETGEPGMSAMIDRAMGRGSGSLSDKVGSRVLPEFLTVIDDPTLATRDGQTLLGSYKVDVEGVPGRRKTLVDAGILKSLLSTRNPVEGMPRSSGNNRGGGAAPSNMMVESSAGISDAELRTRLLDVVKKRGLAYGIVVRELGAGAAFVPEDPMEMFTAMRQGGGGGRAVLRVYKLYPGGREELVRGARLSDVTTQSFRDILAVSSGTTVYSRAAGGFGPGPGFMLEDMFGDEAPTPAMATYVVPSLLFDDVALTRTTGQLPKPPLSAPPAPGHAPQ
jgi:predicted Zn-dependent protease